MLKAHGTYPFDGRFSGVRTEQMISEEEALAIALTELPLQATQSHIETYGLLEEDPNWFLNKSFIIFKKEEDRVHALYLHDFDFSIISMPVEGLETVRELDIVDLALDVLAA